MRIAIATSATAGGAGVAASRVADALRRHGGHEVDVIDVGVLGDVPQEAAPQCNASNRRISDTHFTADRATIVREWCVQLLAGYEVVNLHWTSYLLSAAEVHALASTGVRVLVTLHDFNTVTGGCHYPAGCTGLFEACEACPQVDESIFPRLAVMRAKALKSLTLRRPNVHLCAPSRYVLDTAGRAGSVPSSRLHLIRNPYMPLDVAPGRNATDRTFTVILVADSLSERRKGATLAADVLQRFAADRRAAGRSLRIDVVGTADPGLVHALKATGAELHAHGRLTDHARLVALYAQADVQLCTSYEDNWPNVLVEGGAYGCLAVVGPGHGCEEFVQALKAGVVAASFAPADFASALEIIASLDPVERARRQDMLAADVRRQHDPARIADAYADALAPIAAGAAAAPAPAPAPASLDRLSSNRLGSATRLALAQAGPDLDGELCICRIGQPAAGGEIRLHAVYGSPGSVQLAVQPMTGATLRLPLRTACGPLRHVFAREHADYGLTVFNGSLTDPSSSVDPDPASAPELQTTHHD